MPRLLSQMLLCSSALCGIALASSCEEDAGLVCGASGPSAMEEADAPSLLSLGRLQSQASEKRVEELEGEVRRLKEQLAKATQAILPCRAADHKGNAFAEFVQKVTSGDTFVGNKLQYETAVLPDNEKHCHDALLENTPLYGSPEPPPTVVTDALIGGSYTYYNYAESSRYALEMQQAVNDADKVLTSLFEVPGGLGKGVLPAMMFDIDNTLAFTGPNDTDLAGHAPPIRRAVAFAKKWCRDLGTQGIVDCYFFTARYCTSVKAEATKRWVMENFAVSEEWVLEHVRITGGITGCSSEQCSVAMKDVVRKWYMEKRGLIWVMSVGDQYTDSLGHFSGFKVKLPNFFFDSSAFPNFMTQGNQPPFFPDGKLPADMCKKNCVAAPSDKCIKAGLRDDQAYVYTSLSYCLAQEGEPIEGKQYNIFTGKVE